LGEHALSPQISNTKNQQAAGCKNLNLPLSLSTWTLLYLRLKVTDFDLRPLRPKFASNLHAFHFFFVFLLPSYRLFQ
jgi:hypothetical protein